MSKEKSLILIIALIILGIGSRFLFLIDGYPQIPNFTALGAVALFGAFYLKKIQSIVIPLIILWISDLVLNNIVYSEYYTSFSFFGDPWVNVGFLATIMIGWYFLKKLSIKSLLGASLIGAFVFFLITNFSSWLTLDLYPKNLEGLLTSYIKGIPFFRNAFLGNVFFSSILFGSYYFIKNKSTSLITT
tara:strand:+ start:225 stop:788 length:564 start_codon:yes stop_codon:yes gene_type:complete